MIRLSPCGLLSALLLVWGCTSAPTNLPQVAMIRVGAGFDGDVAVTAPLTIAVDGDRMIAVDRGEGGAAPQTSASVRGAGIVVDVPGGFVMPGLINAHEHLLATHHLTKPEQGEWDAVFGPHWRNVAVPGYLMDFGVTTIHGLAGPLYPELALRDRFLRAYRNGMPDYLTTGAIVTNAGGYPHYVDGWRGGLLVVKAEADTPAAAAAWVQYLHDAGVDAIKVAAGDRAYGGMPLPQHVHGRADIVAATVDAAHRLGLRVFAHAYGHHGFAAVVTSGIDVLAHLPCDPLSDAAAADVARAGIVVIPTIYHMQVRVDAYYPGDVTRVGADFDVQEWRSEFALMEGDDDWGATLLRDIQQFDRPLGSGNPSVPDPPLDFARMAWCTANMRSSLARLYAAGVTIAYGQDSSHGLPWRDLRELARAGLPPAAVLRAATSGAAQAIGKDNDRGRLRPGARADLVIYSRSPLEELRVMRQPPLAVIRNGTLVRCDRAQWHDCPAGVAARLPALTAAQRLWFNVRYLAVTVAGIARGAWNRPG